MQKRRSYCSFQCHSNVWTQRNVKRLWRHAFDRRCNIDYQNNMRFPSRKWNIYIYIFVLHYHTSTYVISQHAELTKLSIRKTWKTRKESKKGLKYRKSTAVTKNKHQLFVSPSLVLLGSTLYRIAITHMGPWNEIDQLNTVLRVIFFTMPLLSWNRHRFYFEPLLLKSYIFCNIYSSVIISTKPHALWLPCDVFRRLALRKFQFWGSDLSTTSMICVIVMSSIHYIMYWHHLSMLSIS